MTLLVAGGGSGIGRATAWQAPAPEPVVVFDRDPEGARAVVDELRSAGREAATVVGDVRAPDDCERAVAQADRLGAGLDSVALCSGTIAGDDTLAAVSTEHLRTIIDVNLVGPAILLQQSLPVLLRRERSAIVLVSSVTALRGRRRVAAYSASKAGLLGLARSVAADYAPRGVRINTVCPGPTDTPMTRGLSTRAPLNAVGRSATATEMAEVVIWLLSDAARWVNAAELVVDQAETATASGMFTPQTPKDP